MQVQQLEVKLFVETDTNIDQQALIPIFHRWIQEHRLGDVLLIDVADYSHVPDGPGVMLLGHGVQWKMDGDGGEIGFAFARKRDQPGDLAGKLAEAFAHLSKAADALEQEPSLRGTLRLDRSHGQVTVMSRLVAANDQKTYDEFAPILQEFLRSQHNAAEVAVNRASSDPREPLAVRFRLPS